MRAILKCFLVIALLVFISPGLIGKTSIDSGVFFVENLTPNPSPKERGIYLFRSPSSASWRRYRVRLISPRYPLLQQFIRNKLPAFHENKRITAATLAILLGPFGVHRLYLGTDPRVPIGYTLTLGGCLYIVPLIDAGVILFSKDLSKFQNNPKFFMWAE